MPNEFTFTEQQRHPFLSSSHSEYVSPFSPTAMLCSSALPVPNSFNITAIRFPCCTCKGVFAQNAFWLEFSKPHFFPCSMVSTSSIGRIFERSHGKSYFCFRLSSWVNYIYHILKNMCMQLHCIIVFIVKTVFFTN